ncbi:MAG: alpha/beta hydrolase [Bacteroidales bacterium]|nr:alpha/beta hydrolase [Bacteroidales bacterium]
MKNRLFLALATMVGFMTLANAQPQGGFKMPKNTATYKDVNYAGDNLEAHRMDIYLPDTLTSHKVVVIIYGSAWFANNAKQMAYLSIGKPLVDAGFAVVSINHRSSADAKFPAQIHDVKAAVRFIRANASRYKLDTSFIGITGFSSGGHLSSLAGVTNGVGRYTIGQKTVDIEGSVGQCLDFSSRVDAVVDWFGPVDMAHMENCETVKDEKSPEAALMGCAPASAPDLVSLISPISYVHAGCPRFMVIHGTADDVVPSCQSERFAGVLANAGRLDTLIKVNGGKHGPVTFNVETFRAMTRFFTREATRSVVVEEGGLGQYPAVMRDEVTLPAHTVFVPQDLTPFNAQNPLPVLVWGNGACTNSPWEHFKFLNEIASHGYLVLATGYIPMEEVPYRGPMSTTGQQIESIDWAIGQNRNPESPFYGRIDTAHICVAGMSCGGLQTLYNCADPRISALMVCNSGLFKMENAVRAMPGMPMPQKSKLAEIHTPVLYILGGESDIAYVNGMDYFSKITLVTAAVANFPVGHGGTYRQPHGGEFSVVATAWLDWQLKGSKEGAKMFLGRKCLLLQREGWTLEKNRLFDKLK